MKIAVYCSAKDRIPEEYLALGDVLGKYIAEAGHILVYGGATGGLMTRVSQAAKAVGGTVEGVIPQRIIQAKRMADNCDTLYVVDNMCERKQKMKELADCFVCLPGSYGTMDEMMDVIASGTVNEHRKPIYILNYKGFYEGLKQQAAHMRQLAFLPPVEQYAPQFVDTMEELINKLK
jgi:uncharacterized protein (TIGR00730 family)